eukprot:UN07947
MGTNISINTAESTVAVMERESSYSSTFSTNITMRISSLDESLMKDEINKKPYQSSYISSPTINELNECNNMMDENGNITVNSYCYCDCESAFAVVTQVLNNGYKIIDLFEQRERISYSNKLTLIDDPQTLKIAKKQYEDFC